MRRTLLPILVPIALLATPALAQAGRRAAALRPDGPGVAASGAALPAAPATVTYTYDAAGRLTEASYGPSRKIVYTYDAAGNLTSRSIRTSFGDPTGDGTIDVFDVVTLAGFIVGNVQVGQPPFLGSLQAVNLNPSQGPAVDIFDLVILANFIVGNLTTLPVP